MRERRGLKDCLRGEKLALAVGAHDALCARLVEEAGFDAVWASGFGVSAASAVPDANVLTMTEMLDSVRRITDAVEIPVLADCDSGYGNVVNVIRTVREYERAGVAGICLEDNVFPKRCSFYDDVGRELVSAAEHASKIAAAKDAQRDGDFVVIARTEALIAGYGVEEACVRADAYADAGADAILCHSKSSTAAELLEFARRWEGSLPLVAVPTTYFDVSEEDLAAAGVKLAIFANQPLRAVIPAIRRILASMRAAGSAGVVEDEIASLEDVSELVRLAELEDQERRYLPGARGTAAAGRGGPTAERADATGSPW